ncbi:MAG TPA: nitronate monooxygenase [Burkholderiales bacterium]|nr:nitronate monooxygenase [Burkholderiales bacterium]
MTPFARKLGIRLPIIAAPMAGGPSTQELVAACSAAGALGSFGFAYTQPADMKRQAAWVRERTSAPFGINLFVAPQPDPIAPDAQSAALEAVAGYYTELGLPAPQPVAAPYAPSLEEQLAAVEELRPAVFTVHLGSLSKEEVKRFQSKGSIVGGSANCVAEAQGLEAAGFDFVIAQGGEAGGHRGSYLRDPYQSLTGTLALTRMIVRAVKIPVVAAGGIMDGAGIAAVLALGAQAAQLGTAFIPCPESGAAQVHKDLLLKATEDDTRVTEKFSGKPARGLANRFMREMQDKPQLAFPAQNSVTGKLRQASAKAGKPDFIALWAGQAAALSRALPAAELIRKLEGELLASLNDLKGLSP